MLKNLKAHRTTNLYYPQPKADRIHYEECFLNVLSLPFRKENEDLFKRPFKIVGNNKRLSTEFEEELVSKEPYKNLKYVIIVFSK
jgi:hypothetical protein